MIKPIAAAILASLAVLAWRPPVALVDHALARASEGRLRLADAQGSLWRGSGTLALSEDRFTVRPLRQVEWGVGFTTHAVTVVLSEHGREQVALSMSPRGVSFQIDQLDIPLRLIRGASNHPAARLGWGGGLNLTSSGMSCDWSRHCNGQLDILWHDVTLAIVPDRALGDHLISLSAAGDRIAVQAHTLRGDLRIDGQGDIDADGRGNFRGYIQGDPDIVDRLPNIMDRNTRPTGVAGRVEIAFP